MVTGTPSISLVWVVQGQSMYMYDPLLKKTFWILHAVTGHFGLSLCRFGPKSLQPESFWSHGRFGQYCCVVSAIRRLHVHEVIYGTNKHTGIGVLGPVS